MKYISFKTQKENYFQKEKIKILKQLKFAKGNVGFYKTALQKIDLNQIKIYSDFQKLIPIITPEMVVKNPKKFSSNLDIEFIRQSSSTTGKPKKIFLTKHDLNHWAKAGRLNVTPYFKKGMTVAHSRRHEKNYLSSLDKSVKESGGKIITFDPRETKNILDCLKKADVILDYAELIYYISELVKTKNTNLNKSIILSYTGNRLDKQDITKIKNNFGKIGVNAEIYSEYATTEIGPIGCSDNKNNNLFENIYDDIAFIEVVDPNTNQPSKNGEIVVTALNRTGSVYIRYKVGDMGTLSFKDNKAFFLFKKRKCGIKIASVFLSPERVFRIIRRQLKQPIYCNIQVRQNRFRSKITINIILKKTVSLSKIEFLKDTLLNELEFIDDDGLTVEFNLKFRRKKINDKEIRKGYKFSLVEN